MLREFAHLSATRFQSTPKAFGVGPTAKIAVLHGRLIRAIVEHKLPVCAPSGVTLR